MRVHPVSKAVERSIKAAASAEQGWWDGILPDCWLLIEWPAGAEAPTDYWLSNLPADTPIADLVRLAKVRWRIEHDYRELKHGLGLDHFEGRSWPGPRRRAPGRMFRRQRLAQTSLVPGQSAGTSSFCVTGAALLRAPEEAIPVAASHLAGDQGIIMAIACGYLLGDHLCAASHHHCGGTPWIDFSRCATSQLLLGQQFHGVVDELVLSRCPRLTYGRVVCSHFVDR